MTHMVVYDLAGKIIIQVTGDRLEPPTGIPHIMIEDYKVNRDDDNYRPITGVDVSVEPHQLIYGKTRAEEKIANYTIEEYREARQKENKEALATFLNENPLLWTDGLYYGVTQEDQNEMIADKTAYDFKHQMGDTEWKLQWHSVKTDCRDFTEEEFAGLLNAIINFVYPYRQLEMKYKDAIYQAETKEEIAAIELIYALPEQPSEETTEENPKEEVDETTEDKEPVEESPKEEVKEPVDEEVDETSNEEAVDDTEEKEEVKEDA